MLKVMVSKWGMTMVRYIDVMRAECIEGVVWVTLRIKGRAFWVGDVTSPSGCASLWASTAACAYG